MMDIADMAVRPLEESDLDDLYRLTSNERVARYMRFDTHTDIEQTREILREYQKLPAAFAVLIGGRFAGVFSLTPAEEPAAYTVSVYLDEPFWNKGYASRLMGQMKAYARTELGARVLIGYVVSLNEGSKRTLLKNGYVLTQTLTFPDLPDGLEIYRCELT